jgi:hypothetical protein
MLKILTAALVAVAGSAGAATLNIKSGSTVVGSLTCAAANAVSPECKGIVGGSIEPASAGFLSVTEADLFAKNAGSNSGAPDVVAAELNILTGDTSFTTGDRTNVGSAAESRFGFTTTAAFFALKLGNNFAFFANTSGEALEVSFSKIGSGGFGLSNITEFGETPSPVPLPAAAWLMLVGFGGLAAVGRRRASA